MSEQYTGLLKKMRERDQKGPASFVEAIFPTPMFKVQHTVVKKIVRAIETPEVREEVPEEKIEAAPIILRDLPAELIAYRHQKLNESRPRIVFVSDRLITSEEHSAPSIPLDLQYTFLPEEAELFHRMSAAMKLLPRDYQVSAVRFNQQSEELDYLDQLKSEIVEWNPEMIITLGAVALNSILPDAGKLSKVHGQLLNFAGTKLVPLFHPQFLLINPAMKKTTWMDMQKVMELLSLK